MKSRTRAAIVTALSVLGCTALAAPAADASLLSILPGSCSGQTYSQPFARWGDTANYVLMPGGSFEAGGLPWFLSGGAKPTSGNETYKVHAAADATSLALPAGSSATSPPACTSIYHPTMRFFLRNTGASTSGLKVEALYPGLLGGIQVATLSGAATAADQSPGNAVVEPHDHRIPVRAGRRHGRLDHRRRLPRPADEVGQAAQRDAAGCGRGRSS
jgi:hypothetical protein